MASRANVQLNLPPTEVRRSEPREPSFREPEPSSAGRASFRNSEQNEAALGNSEHIAADVLNTAFQNARLDNKEIAHLCGVSVSLVEKWRSTEARGCPSFAQLLMLPPAFHIELHRALNKRFGFGRAALNRLTDAMADLALVVEA